MVNIVKYNKLVLKNLVWEDVADDCSLKIISDEVVGNSRWSIEHELIFSDVIDGKTRFFKTDYRVGATEQQDEQAFEYSPDEVDCIEVALKEKVVIVYDPL